jgi:tetratricopeptide (TPR) repeat protein
MISKSSTWRIAACALHLNRLMRPLNSRVLTATGLLLVAAFVCGCSAGAKKSRIQARADQYFQSGEYEKAKVEYLNLLRLEQNPKAFQQIGFIWMKEGAPLRALPFLLKVRELTPDNTEARTQLAVALVALGDPSEARKEALAALKRDPGNSNAIVILADASLTKDEITEAEQQIERFTNKNTAAFHLAKASLALNKGEMSTEAEELQEAVRTEPKSARAHLALGYAYQLRGNPDHAGPELKIASELASPRSEERIKHAEFEAANGHLTEAKTVLQAISKETPDYLPVWQDLAKVAVTEGQYDQALSLLENLFSRNPEDPDARLLEAQVWLAKGDPAKATAIADRVNTNYPNNALIKYTLARTYIASNNPLQAETALQQAISIKPDYPEAVLLLAELSLQSGKAQNVVALLEDLLKKRPDLAQARTMLANAHRALGQLDDAAAVSREQTQMVPNSSDAYLAYGLVLRQQNKNDEAREAFEKASELNPDSLSAVDQLLEMDLAEKRYDAAAQRVEQQAQKHPNTAGAYFLQARMHLASGPQKDFARAEGELQKAIQLNSNFVSAYETLVSLFISENKLPEAVTQLKTEMDKNPKDPRPVLMTALVYEQTKDYPGARDAYLKVLSLSSSSVLALNNLAYLYSEQFNQLDQAYDLAQKARNLELGNGRVADTLGWILYKRGDYPQALKLAQESAAKFPDNPVIQFHLGMISYMNGQLDLARSALEKAAHSRAEFPEKAEAERRLTTLEGAASGKGEQSIPLLEASLKQQPNDVVVLQQLGQAYENNRQYDKAAATYEQIMKLNPRLPAATLKLAQLYSGPLEKPDQALEMAKKARELYPNDPDASAAIGHIALQAGNYTWAYSLLKDSTRKTSSNPTAFHDLALSAYALGKVPEAGETMQRYLSANPGDQQSKEAKQFLTLIALEQPSPDAVAAEPEVQNRLSANPDDLPALMTKAAITLQQGDEKSATAIYEKVLQKYPDFAPAQKRLAAIYKDHPEEVTKAYDLAMKARKTLTNDAELARTLARISFKRNDFPYAAQLFEESARTQALGADDLYYLGMAQFASHQETKARETLARALAAGLQDPLAEEAKKRLANRTGK